jgi:hypothetical protein
MAVGAVIVALGGALFSFEIAHPFGFVVFLIGFAIVVWGQVVYVRALRQQREGPSATSQPQGPKGRP